MTKLRNKQEEVFHDKLAKSYDLSKIDVEKYFERQTSIEYRYVLTQMGELKGKRVLDLGCGFGELSIFFALKKAKVTAVDISKNMLKVVDLLAKKYKVKNRVKTVKSPAEKLPFRSNSFDLVYGGNVLHHVDIPQAGAEVHRVLKKNGKAFFIEPLGYNPLINIYRMLSKDVHTKMETPFVFGDVKTLGKKFRKWTHVELQLFTTLIFVWFFLAERQDPRKVRYWRKFIEEGEKYEKAFNFLHSIDKLVLRLPVLRALCWNTIIKLEK